ncbi:hypothetical protein SBRY_20664 [Actinacidiphila bryophytorum]|uniref:Uncharacterized protein n=1 Tax=Actinacidiphila bryophytorum TaxID=1436133 RepID=A0A9W4EA10_9ACTN|nr:hypothetical protein SBRY_20664 [Actinacidiphila bryophytorum]
MPLAVASHLSVGGRLVAQFPAPLGGAPSAEGERFQGRGELRDQPTGRGKTQRHSKWLVLGREATHRGKDG